VLLDLPISNVYPIPLMAKNEVVRGLDRAINGPSEFPATSLEGADGHHKPPPGVLSPAACLMEAHLMAKVLPGDSSCPHGSNTHDGPLPMP